MTDYSFQNTSLLAVDKNGIVSPLNSAEEISNLFNLKSGIFESVDVSTAVSAKEFILLHPKSSDQASGEMVGIDTDGRLRRSDIVIAREGKIGSGGLVVNGNVVASSIKLTSTASKPYNRLLTLSSNSELVPSELIEHENGTFACSSARIDRMAGDMDLNHHRIVNGIVSDCVLENTKLSPTGSKDASFGYVVFSDEVGNCDAI
jgi:hypothetical protein